MGGGYHSTVTYGGTLPNAYIHTGIISKKTHPKQGDSQVFMTLAGDQSKQVTSAPVVGAGKTNNIKSVVFTL